MIWDPDCKGPCDCPGEEVAQAPTVLTCSQPGCNGDGRYAPPGRGHTCSGPPESRDAHMAQLAQAWQQGYSAGDLDSSVARCLEIGIPVPEGQAFPSVNPYRREVTETFACDDHKPVQHRDAKRPWCNRCGRAANGELIGRPESDQPVSDALRCRHCGKLLSASHRRLWPGVKIHVTCASSPVVDGVCPHAQCCCRAHMAPGTAWVPDSGCAKAGLGAGRG